MTRKKNTSVNFENALDELNSIVNKMETGNLTLEESLAQFERGIVLTRQCQSVLNEAEQKIKMLIQQDDDPVLETYANE